MLQGGPDALASGADAAWALPIGAAVLAVRHVGLSGWQPRECAAVENELAAWQKLGEFSSADNALRCATSAQRTRRGRHLKCITADSRNQQPDGQQGQHDPVEPARDRVNWRADQMVVAPG